MSQAAQQLSQPPSVAALTAPAVRGREGDLSDPLDNAELSAAREEAVEEADREAGPSATVAGDAQVGDDEPEGDAAENDAAENDAEKVTASNGEGLASAGPTPDIPAPPEEVRGAFMKLPTSPLADECDDVNAPMPRPPPPKGMETFDLFGTTFPSPFYSKTQMTKDAIGSDAQLVLSGIVYGGDKVINVADFVLPKAIGLGKAGKQVIGGAAFKVAGKVGMAAMSKAGMYLGPLAAAAGAASIATGIYDAINEGPGLFNKLTNNDLSDCTRAGAALRAVSISAGILSGVAGLVGGTALTAAAILTLTGYGAALLPKLGKVALVSTIIGAGFTGLGIAATVGSTLLQKIGALDDNTRMLGVRMSAHEALKNAEGLIGVSKEAAGHEASVLDESAAALQERVGAPDATNPFDIMHTQAQAHEQADLAAAIAGDFAANVEREDSPMLAAYEAHHASAEHLDLLIGTAYEKQLALQSAQSTATTTNDIITGAGGVVGKMVSGRLLVEPLVRMMTSPLVKSTAEGKGAIANFTIPIFTLRGISFIQIPNPIAIQSAKSAMLFAENVRELYEAPERLMKEAFDPLKPVMDELNDRDVELAGAIKTIHRAKAAHDEAGGHLAQREAKILAAFGFASKTAKDRLSLRDSLSPRILASISNMEGDAIDAVMSGDEPDPSGDSAVMA